VQFLPDVEIPCPDCRGTRYAKDADQILCKTNADGRSYTLPALMAMSVDEALAACHGLRLVEKRLQVLHDLGLGYLTLGEETPGLSGGEAQRLKLASEMGRPQADSLFIFDEPTIGLHPLDVATLLRVFQTLIDQQATVIVIEHDLDVIRNADYIVDMGPGGGESGGRIVAAGTLGSAARREGERDRKIPVSRARRNGKSLAGLQKPFLRLLPELPGRTRVLPSGIHFFRSKKIFRAVKSIPN
jgi:excinuclease ABC subunit A